MQKHVRSLLVIFMSRGNSILVFSSKKKQSYLVTTFQGVEGGRISCEIFFATIFCNEILCIKN